MAPPRPGSGRTALFVLAAPGADAELVTRVLELSGAAPVADRTAVAAFNDARLAAAGSSRADPLGPRRRLDADAAPAEAEVARAAELLVTAEPHEPLLFLSDPACTRLHALWAEALERRGWRPAFVTVLSPPAEAAARLRADTGLPRSAGLLLWTSYMLDAERAARGGRRVTLGAERLRADPEAELDRLERALGLHLPRRSWDAAAEIEALLREGPPPPVTAALPDALAPVGAFAEHLAAAARDEPGNADVAAETARWFSALAELMAPMVRRPEASADAAAPPSAPDPDLLERAREEARGAGVRAEAAEAQTAILQSALHVARRRSAEAESLLQARAAEASAGEREARAALATALSSREALQRDLDDAAAELTVARKALAVAAEELRDAEAEIEDERARHGEAREHLALVGVANHAAQTRVRELQARLDAAAERRRRWLPRLFGLR